MYKSVISRLTLALEKREYVTRDEESYCPECGVKPEDAEQDFSHHHPSCYLGNALREGLLAIRRFEAYEKEKQE